MSRLLAEHDRLVRRRGRPRRRAPGTPTAIKVLDEAEAQIAAARALRDKLAATVDVSSSTSG